MEEMHEQGGGWFSWCKPEWQVISAAPRAFAVSLLAVSILILVGVYWLFRANLDLKTDLITSLKDENVSLKAEQDRLKSEVAASKTNPSKERSVTVEPDYKKWFSDKQETISRRKFANESIEIDGKLFDQCEFVNVTFIYHGLAPTTFIKGRFVGSIVMQTDNAAAKSWAKLAAFFHNLPNMKTFAQGEKDASGTLHIVTHETMMQLAAPKKKDGKLKK